MKKITLLVLFVFTITSQGQNKLLSSIDESYIGSSWVKDRGSNYEYDSNNNLIKETGFSWNSTTNKWENSWADVYTYNANNKTTELIGYQWDNQTSRYVKSYRITYNYNGIGNIIEIIEDDWDGFQWEYDYKSNYSYNSNNLLSSYIEYSWDGIEWKNSYRGTLTYNSNNKIISSTNDDWAGTLWKSYFRSFLTYNGNNKILTDKGEEFKGSAWVTSDSYNYSFDSTGNVINEIESYSGGQNKSEYSYDTSSLMSNFAHPFKDKTGLDYLFESFPYVNKILTESHFYYDSSTNQFELSSKTTYNYDNTITLSTQNIEKELVTISVFPNPTQDFLSIQTSLNTAIDKISITDLTGKTVLQQSQNTTQVDVRQLAKGMYIVQVFSGKEKFQTKFIKE